MEIVAPFAGAWIEIDKAMKYAFERIVAPFAGAWIEISPVETSEDDIHGRSVRRSVD